MTNEKAIMCLEDMKIKVPIPKAAKQARENNEALDVAIKALQSAEPKRGKWIDKGEHGDWEWHADGRGQHWHEWECNTCHHYFEEISFFCPYCGSDMREVTT